MTHRKMTSATQADAGFETHRKAARRDVSSAAMCGAEPPAEVCARSEPFYPKECADGEAKLSVWSTCCAFTSCSSCTR